MLRRVKKREDQTDDVLGYIRDGNDGLTGYMVNAFSTFDLL
jgi:hypothetical protein